MKKIFMAVIICVSVALSALAIDGLKVNYAGTWALDKAKSESMPQNWGTAENIEIIIAQDDKQLSWETKNARPAFPKISFKLDGSETSAEVTGRLAGTAKSKAKVLADGKQIELNTILNTNLGGNDVVIIENNILELSADGKVLTVTRMLDSPRGKQNFKFTLNKK